MCEFTILHKSSRSSRQRAKVQHGIRAYLDVEPVHAKYKKKK